MPDARSRQDKTACRMFPLNFETIETLRQLERGAVRWCNAPYTVAPPAETPWIDFLTGDFNMKKVWQHTDVRTKPHIHTFRDKEPFVIAEGRLLGVTNRFLSACVNVRPSSAKMRLMLNRGAICEEQTHCASTCGLGRAKRRARPGRISDVAVLYHPSVSHYNKAV